MRPSPKKPFGKQLRFPAVLLCWAPVNTQGGGTWGCLSAETGVEHLVKLLEDRSAEHVLMETKRTVELTGNSVGDIASQQRGL